MKDASLKKAIKMPRIKHFLTSTRNENFIDTSLIHNVPTVLMLTTFPPRECGIATYSTDLKQSLENAFGNSFNIEICELYNDKNPLIQTENLKYSLNTDLEEDYQNLATKINLDGAIELVMIQHEFGLFNGCSEVFITFIKALKKPLVVAFHTVLPEADEKMMDHVYAIANASKCVTVMTESSKAILMKTYGISGSKIKIISHGTHLISHKNKRNLKLKYGLQDRTILSTFGLLGPGKSIETTLEALPEISKEFPDVVFLILGKTHPTLVKNEGEVYRTYLTKKIKDLGIAPYVKFVNEFLPLQTLLEYLQLTDIYLFTSKDPNQAVSGTFAYAMSCGCPIISTPIPHAKEFLSENKGLLFDFKDSNMLSKHLKTLLNDKTYRQNLGLNGLHASAATSWENSALAHGHLFQKLAKGIKLTYQKPEINLKHVSKMTDAFGMIQFSKLNQPDYKSGYTLDDNARALIVLCEYFKLTKEESAIDAIKTYLNFIFNCQRSNGQFLNYVDDNHHFTSQNDLENLEDSNGRAIWGIGHLLELEALFPQEHHYIFDKARECFAEFIPNASNFNSPRAIAFIIKGMAKSRLIKIESFYYHSFVNLGTKLIKMYRHESRDQWKWFEPYLTYGNSVLPEAILEVYKVTKIEEYKIAAFESFNFLLDHLFIDGKFKVISNQTWFLRGDSIKNCSLGGQQPIDVAYTIIALKNFSDFFENENYTNKMELAFSWFMGNNHLNQIVYNPCTAGCFDGLELHNVNLNQGAESTLSYLMARLAFEF